jgi:ligand-binding sensor domain-containing protein/signal transduction histidine kinase
MKPVEKKIAWRVKARAVLPVTLWLVSLLTTLESRAASGSEAKWPGTVQSLDQYSSRVWQTDEGLPNNRVSALAQTADGFLWVGTFEGLARFDGIEFTTYNNANTPQLRNAPITSLCPAADGSIWVGTRTGGLARIEHGALSLFTSNNGLAGDNIRALARSADGAIWIGTTQGLSRYLDGKFRTFTTREGLSLDSITALCADRDGSIWVGTAKGLNRARGEAIETFPLTGDFTNEPVRALWLDKQDQLWIKSDRGLLLYDSRRLRAFEMPDGFKDNVVTAIYEDRQTNLWVGSYNGLHRFSQGRFEAVLNGSGTPYDQVNTVIEDSQGDIWAGSREGLIRLTRKPFSVTTKGQWLKNNHVTCVVEDHRNRLWVGTWGGGISEIFQRQVNVYGTTHQLSSDMIKALWEDHDGNIWAGADNNGGLFRITGEGVAHYGESDGLLDSTISVLHEDREHNLWIGTRLGLCRLSHGVFVTETNVPNRPVWAICEDSHGRMWFGGDAGLFRRREDIIENLNSGSFSSESVSALHADPNDNIWVGTRNGGLLHWSGERCERFGLQDGLYSSEILGIAEDDGWLWMTSTKGIFRVRRHDLETLRLGGRRTVACVTYGKSDGLESIVCGNWSAPSIWKTGDGLIYFATTIGLAAIDARNTPVDLSPPLVYIEQMEVDRKTLSLIGGSLIVPPSRGELDFRYTALDLRAPEKCRFKYRLDGVDSDWTDADTHRTAHYSNVNPGSYSFHVLACNKDGVWAEMGASLPFELRPHFWQTWWFRVLALAALAGFAGGSARFVVQRKMQRKLELAERRHAVERERGRIARDIHDDLGSSLTRIMLLGQRAEKDLAERREIGVHLKKIVNFSRATIQAMDEIVWAVNPRNDSLDGLVSYLNDYAAQFFQDTCIRCRLQMPVTSHVTLRTEVRHDLFLAFKEALTNVLKHSLASEVHVRVLNSGSDITIIIEDNGRGFDADGTQNHRHGNGLQNMRKRIDAVSGQMEITTAPGHGTRLQFTLHVPAQSTN